MRYISGRAPAAEPCLIIMLNMSAPGPKIKLSDQGIGQNDDILVYCHWLVAALQSLELPQRPGDKELYRIPNTASLCPPNLLEALEPLRASLIKLKECGRLAQAAAGAKRSNKLLRLARTQRAWKLAKLRDDAQHERMKDALRASYRMAGISHLMPQPQVDLRRDVLKRQTPHQVADADLSPNAHPSAEGPRPKRARMG